MHAPGTETLSGLRTIADAAGEDLEAAVEQYARTVYRVAYSVLRNHHDAEDAVQETFLRLVRHQKDWVAVRDRRAWLARVAWRVALDRRRAAPEISLEDAAGAVRDLRAAGASADEIAEREQMTALLAKLIATLPEDLRNVVTLSTVEDLTSPEIAEVLGIPEGSVRERLMRARGILKEKLSRCLERKDARRKE
jgi:RNA polymerase sigma-70 factor (ECF subfamily)